MHCYHFILLIIIIISTQTQEKKVHDCTKGDPIFNDGVYYHDAYAIIDKEPEKLAEVLSTIIDDHKVFNYSCVWTILEESDRFADDYVESWYSGELIHIDNKDTGNNETDVWNREHLWPSSHGIPNNSTAYTDVHHVRACSKQINSARQDKDFKYGGDYECINPYNYNYDHNHNYDFNLLHNSCDTFWLYTNTSVEIPDRFKGDTARAMFYMATRYIFGDVEMEPLVLVNHTTFGSQKSELGFLCDLIDWHYKDSVSVEELERNEIIFKWQENRNPYVDHPEWVDIIFLNIC